MSQHRVDQIKAAFILNIIRFVSWPEITKESINQPLRLCLYQSSSNAYGAMSSINNKKASGRKIQLTPIESLAESQPCHILVIAPDTLDDFNKEIHPGLNRPMLTIADLTYLASPPPVHKDILVALVRNGSRIGFQINLNKTRQVGLWMSSKLLKLATIVGSKN